MGDPGEKLLALQTWEPTSSFQSSHPERSQGRRFETSQVCSYSSGKAGTGDPWNSRTTSLIYSASSSPVKDIVWTERFSKGQPLRKAVWHWPHIHVHTCTHHHTIPKVKRPYSLLPALLGVSNLRERQKMVSWGHLLSNNDKLIPEHSIHMCKLWNAPPHTGPHPGFTLPSLTRKGGFEFVCLQNSLSLANLAHFKAITTMHVFYALDKWLFRYSILLCLK